MVVKKGRYNEAKTSIKDRDANIQKAVESIETELELLCLTGVEDKLQVTPEIPPTYLVRKMSNLH